MDTIIPTTFNYSIPMKGNGKYNAHSDLQRDVMTEALPILHAATVRATQNLSSVSVDSLRVIEYGASHGANSISPLETILLATTRANVVIELNDRPENDFNTLSLTINQWEDFLDTTQYAHKLFISFTPRSFYKPLHAVRELDIGYSFTCLHFLETMPSFPGCHFTAARSSQTMDMFRAQANVDLQKFLRLRALEFVSGGQLVLSLIATGFGHPDFMDSGPGDAMRSAMSRMLSEGKLTQAAIDACVIPVYFRTMQDIQTTLSTVEVNRQWITVRLEQSQVMHPFWRDLEHLKQQGLNSDGHSLEYAKAMVTWFLAVFEGFFLRAVTSASSQLSARDLLEELKEKAIQIFLEKYKDNPVYLSSVYVHLQANKRA